MAVGCNAGAVVVSAAARHTPAPSYLMAASYYGIPSFPIVKFVIYHTTAWIPLRLTLPSILPPLPSSLPPPPLVGLMRMVTDGVSPCVYGPGLMFICAAALLSGSLPFPS